MIFSVQQFDDLLLSSNVDEKIKRSPAPAPTPNRATYGFVFYLASYTAFAFYIIWTLFPVEDIENMIGFSIFPQRYWAVAIPVHLFVTLMAIAFVVYPAINLMMVPSLNDSRLITDKFADYVLQPIPGSEIPQITDIPPNEVTETLFLQEY